MKRDSLYIGVAEGNVNTQRIISMLNVSDNELVVDAKGIYSIENYLTARMFMYWQVYYHKTSALAEHLLVKILDRAKVLISDGASLPASENLLYFLEKGKFVRAGKEDIRRFTELDDSDIIQAIKLWTKNGDAALSYLCNCIIKRKFPKTIVSSAPFDSEMVAAKIAAADSQFGEGCGKEVVSVFSRSLLPYNSQRKPILLLEKSGKKTRLEKSENQILSKNITETNTRHYLSFPLESL